MTTETTKADKLAAEYRPTMTLEVLHSWAAEAAALMRANAAVVPDGWKLTQKATCYQLTCGNTVVANLVGHDAEDNAAKLANLLASPSAPVLAEPLDDEDACRSEPSEWVPPADYDGDGSVAAMARRAAQPVAKQPVQGGGDAVTDAMVDAYLKANDAYWRRTDQLPTPPDKWRTGTPREATHESLRAALATLTPTAPGAQEKA